MSGVLCPRAPRATESPTHNVCDCGWVNRALGASRHVSARELGIDERDQLGFDAPAELDIAMTSSLAVGGQLGDQGVDARLTDVIIRQADAAVMTFSTVVGCRHVQQTTPGSHPSAVQ
jgi:hypothetical protein